MAEVLSGAISEARDQEVQIERPDGSRITVIVNIRPLKNEHGEILGAINCFVDISERKQAEEARARLATIVEFSDDAMISKTLDGTITTWNRGAERLFGYAADEAIGQNITLIIPPDRLPEEATILERLRRAERVEHFETQRLRKDGRLLDISLTISPVKDSSGRVVGASKVARDITERKLAEKDGVQAIQVAQERGPDLIVLDLAMPVMNGLEAARALKLQIPAVPLLMFTNTVGALIEQEARSAGIAAVFSKTGPPDLLIDAIKALLR